MIKPGFVPVAYDACVGICCCGWISSSYKSIFCKLLISSRKCSVSIFPVLKDYWSLLMQGSGGSYAKAISNDLEISSPQLSLISASARLVLLQDLCRGEGHWEHVRAPDVQPESSASSPVVLFRACVWEATAAGTVSTGWTATSWFPLQNGGFLHKRRSCFSVQSQYS